MKMGLDTVHPSERADARANRARLIEGARAVFSDRGFGAEMKEISERAGVGVGTIYRNFPSKEDLILAIVRDALAAAIAEARVAEAMDDSIEGLRTLLASALAMVGRYGWLADAMLGGQFPPSPQMRAELQSHDYPRRFERLIRRAVDEGRLRRDIDVSVAAATLAGTTSPWNYRRFLAERTPEQAAEAVMTSFLRGCAPEVPS